LNSRALCQIKLAFVPISECEYIGKAILETDEGKFPIELIGESVTPKVLINKNRISINEVVVNSTKSDEIIVSNECSIPIKLNLNFTNSAFFSDKR